MTWNRRSRSGTPVIGPSGRSDARVKAEWYGELVRRSKIHLDSQIDRIDAALLERHDDPSYLRELLRQLGAESALLRLELDKSDS